MSNTDGLKLYLFHGLEINKKEGNESITDCPFCGGENKLSINRETTKYKCFVCDANGNDSEFLQAIWQESYDRKNDYLSLSQERGIQPETLESWGVCQSIITNEWIIPGWSIKGEVRQLYIYREKDGKHRLLATPGMAHRLFRPVESPKEKDQCYICEGPWDGMRLEDELRRYNRKSNGRLIPTRSEPNSLASKVQVYAVPGANTFAKNWPEVFRNKHVCLLYDNDHPKTNPKTGKTISPTGWAGMRRTAGILGNSPKSLQYLCWGKPGYDESLPSGTDLRDFLKEHKLPELLERLKPVPEDWLLSETERELHQIRLSPVYTTKWIHVRTAWKKALEWTDNFDICLSVMLACATSLEVTTPRERLWLRAISPASSGKTTLLEGLLVNRDRCVQKSKISGFYSGYKGAKGEDLSLVAQVQNKVLAIKDGDTLLELPNRPQLMAEARDLYDGSASTYFKNRSGKDYENVNFVWIICGTSKLLGLDAAEGGARFLDCVLMDTIDDDLEYKILTRDLYATQSQIEQREALIDQAKELTGGYLEYLRRNTKELVKDITFPNHQSLRLVRLSQLISYMRARQSKTQDEKSERELPKRVNLQLSKLAICLAVVLNRTKVDNEVIRRTIKIGFDTCQGSSLDLCKILYEHPKGLTIIDLKKYSHRSDSQIRQALDFFATLNIARSYRPKENRKKVLWRLTRTLRKLFDDVFHGGT